MKECYNCDYYRRSYTNAMQTGHKCKNRKAMKIFKRYNKRIGGAESFINIDQSCPFAKTKRKDEQRKWMSFYEKNKWFEG